MKKLLLLLSVYFALQSTASATHLIGGEIFYTHEPTSSLPDRYKISVHLYGDFSQSTIPALPSSLPMCYNSSCGSGGTFTLSPKSIPGYKHNNKSAFYLPHFDDCADDINDPKYTAMVTRRYEGYIDSLPPCADWTIWYQICCRSSAVDNIFHPTNSDFAIEAKLNNLDRHNSSPAPNFVPVMNLCVTNAGTPFRLDFSADDADGDSLYYYLKTPRGAAGTCPNLMWSPINFTQGYSATNPVITQAGVLLNPATGILTMAPSQPQTVSITVGIDEYSPTTAGYVLQGTSSREVTINVLNNCKPGVDSLDYLYKMFNKKRCGDSIISFKFTNNFRCSSLSTDGSDFALINSLGQLVPIVGAKAINCFEDGTDEIELYLHEPFYYRDTMTLISRTGSDFNFLQNMCGQEYYGTPANLLEIYGCSTSIYLKEMSLAPMELFPNPAQESIEIHFASPASNRSLTLIDVNGRLLKSFSTSEDVLKINLSDLPAGMYIIRYQTDDGIETARFVKE